MAVQYDYIEEILPREIAFVSTEELVDMYPDLTPKEREYKIVKEKGAVFLMQVGKKLTNGERHDGRAPDYDDWELNGDILVYYPVLDLSLIHILDAAIVLPSLFPLPMPVPSPFPPPFPFPLPFPSFSLSSTRMVA